MLRKIVEQAYCNSMSVINSANYTMYPGTEGILELPGLPKGPQCLPLSDRIRIVAPWEIFLRIRRDFAAL